MKNVLPLTVASYILWGFIEYLYHRFLHVTIYLKSHRQLHHSGITDTPTICAAFLTVLTSIFILLFSWYFQIAVVFSVASGLVLRLALFGVLHSAYHSKKGDIFVLKKLRNHHTLHHANENGNYSVTTRYWDRVFHTKINIRQ